MNHFDYKSLEISSRMFAENEYAFAFLSKMPITPGHTLICPKRPLVASDELTVEEWRDILSLKTQVCHLFRQELRAEGFNFAWNESFIAGQTVPHFHLHIVPRKEGDAGITGYDPRIFLYRPGSRAVTQHEELTSFARKLKLFFGIFDFFGSS